MICHSVRVAKQDPDRPPAPSDATLGQTKVAEFEGRDQGDREAHREDRRNLRAPATKYEWRYGFDPNSGMPGARTY
ncbi:hypothetical protein M2275_008077 [Rhodococcus opacus]|nr:hypothetical protein [Rhodococcus opacus]